ncbi:hypothetical protein ARMGADRAFT_1037980 [Armillaria gallica]|uniref:Uncharacterized protein n=1 Tax=Armillaria gallica TaxID=47427 RepID=A0A2H3D7A7_ARMGA|nr:hypothetical protein ARMGADRAFT_1037980 [Armillaria gallica]
MPQTPTRCAPPQTNALGFDYGFDTLDDFLNTITNDELELGSDSLATHCSPVSFNPRGCVLNTALPNSPLPPSQCLPNPDLDGKAIKPTSWAAKNLTHPLAPTRVHCEVASQRFPVTKVSSAAVKKRLAREKKEVFANDLTKSMEEHLKRLEEISSKHRKKFKDVLCIAGNAGRYKNHCAVSDLQVKILYQTKENNKEKAVGAKLRLEQLQKLAKTDPRYLFQIHGSVDDTMPSSLLQIPGSTAFLSTIVKVDPMDFVQQFEQFSCTVDYKAHEDQSSIRKDIT